VQGRRGGDRAPRVEHVRVGYAPPNVRISASFGGEPAAVVAAPADGFELSLKGTVISLTNLAPEADDDAIKEILSTFGRVKKVEVERVEAGNSVGCAEAVFANYADAQKAVASLDGRIADGRKLRVQITSAPPAPKALPVATHNPVASAVAALGEADVRSYSRPRGREDRPRQYEDKVSRERPRGGRDADRPKRASPAPQQKRAKPAPQQKSAADLESMLDSYMSGKGGEAKPSGKPKPQPKAVDVDDEFEAYLAQRTSGKEE
jgi:RNA recognition motif-containing protein